MLHLLNKKMLWHHYSSHNVPLGSESGHIDTYFAARYHHLKPASSGVQRLCNDAGSLLANFA